MRIAMIGAKGILGAAGRGGGIERHVEHLAVKLVESGHHVFVYVRTYANPEHHKTWQGVRLMTLPSLASKHFDTITHVLFASVHVLFQKVDVIHYHGVGPSLLSWIPRIFKPRARIVVTFHSRDRFHEKWGWWARAWLAFGEWTACVIPHLTIAVSHGIKLFCEQMYGRAAVYIPNGVDVVEHRPGTSYLRALGLLPEEYVVLLGRLIPLKAQDDAIRAYASVVSSKKLLIIGEALYEETEYYLKLQELASKDPRVVLMGFRGGEELRQLLAHCYCMIHPSRVEGLSVAILEAMSFGRLVLMSDIPANRELVDHSGIAYPVGNIKALRSALEWILEDPTLVQTRGARAREVVKEFYSWSHIVKRTEQEYHKLLIPSST